jgi:hypothetical protein
MSTLQSRVSVDADMNRVFTVGAEDPNRLSRMERTRFSWALYEMLGNAEFMYHQHAAKMLSPVVWTRWEATLCWWMSHPGMRAWWVAKPSPFSADFQAFVDEIIRDNRFDSEAIERWREFVAGPVKAEPQ